MGAFRQMGDATLYSQAGGPQEADCNNRHNDDYGDGELGQEFEDGVYEYQVPSSESEEAQVEKHEKKQCMTEGHEYQQEQLEETQPREPNLCSDDDVDVEVLIDERSSARKSGRPQSSVWDSFTVVNVEGRNGVFKRCQCIHCLKLTSSRAYRMRSHLLVCAARPLAGLQLALEAPPKKPKVVKNVPLKMKSVKVTKAVPVVKAVTPQQQQQQLQQQQGAVLPSQNLVNAAKRTRENEKLKLDEQVGRFLFSTNLPFNAVEHDEFKRLVAMLRPGYQPPTRDCIGGTILNTIYKETQEQMKGKIENKAVVLMQDGWSTTQNFPVITHLLHSGDQSHFLNSLQPGLNEKTADYCARLALQAIEEAETKFAARVVGLVTDWAMDNAMEVVKQTVLAVKPSIIIYGCNTHLLNLVGRQMTPKEIVDPIIKVQRYFRNHHFTSAELKLLQGLRTVVPGDARWISQIDCLKSYLKNRLVYIEVERSAAVESHPFDAEVRQIIQDSQLFYEVQQLIAVLEPVKYALDKLQSETATIADSVQQWLTLVKNPIYNDAHRSIICHEMEKGLTPTTIAAYMLHPAKRGDGLDPDIEELGRQWLASRDPMFLCIATSLKHLDSSIFPKSFIEIPVSDIMKPQLWWMGLKGWPRIPESLIDLAVHLMICPASTSSLERSISSMGLMAKLRGRIGNDKATKLCAINRSLRGNFMPTW